MKMPEPIAYMWQHDETGRTGFVEAWQPMDKWKESNPRLRVIGPLYDKQALIDLLEEAAQKAFSWNTAMTDTLAKEIREMKETL
jgi:hypothetical protein